MGLLLAEQKEFPKQIRDKSDTEGKMIINKQVKYSICKLLSGNLSVNTEMEIENKRYNSIDVRIKEPDVSFDIEFFSIEQIRLTANFLLEVADKYEQLIKENND